MVAVWTIRERQVTEELQLSEELGVSKVLASLLWQRGLRSAVSAHQFLHPHLDQLGDPQLLPDYASAVQAILKARTNEHLIFVHGDYDVDGITSSAIFDRFLKSIGCRVHTHVPHRTKEGYGIHEDAVMHASDLGAKLFLTCDCGISAHDQVLLATSLGMEVVVTDHHQIAETIPEAVAVVNPHRADCLYPFKELSGAGIVFRLCEGIARELDHPIDSFRRAFLDLACLGTIADVMPLHGENRVIARFGLERLQATKKLGLQALMREANVGQDPGRPLAAYNVGWHLGPRLNAAGRIEDAATALRLLIERDETRANQLAKDLEAINIDRKLKTVTAVEQAIEQVLQNGYHEHAMIVVLNQEWHPGIVGIVAGRLVERFGRPTLAATIDAHGRCKGSARSIPGFHLAEAIWAFPGIMTGGGHAMAAGCSFALSDLETVRSSLSDFAKQVLKPEDFIPKVVADVEVQPDELDEEAIGELSMLEPFGCENPKPMFLAREVRVKSIFPTRNPNHVRLKLLHGDNLLSGIAFNLGERFQTVSEGDLVDVLFRAELNEFRGETTPQWQVEDFRPSFAAEQG
jgi:single-stranded-DNA-specific exonuclease